ncbi:MAG TPA: MoaD/ThiS family protein [Streptosporangiaceae bacterium]|nr:MoaD/ThiS family protein [Streptosporangiaceae bacterium]
MAIVTLRYWAAAKDAAGVADEKVEATTLADALASALDQAGRPGNPLRLRTVMSRSSFLIDGQPVGKRPHESIALSDDAVIEVLPPFAGG